MTINDMQHHMLKLVQEKKELQEENEDLHARIADQQTQLQRTCQQENDDLSALVEKQAKLLRRTCDALKPAPPENTRLSVHDLPETALARVQELAQKDVRIAELQAGIKQRDEVLIRQVRWLDAMSRSRRDEPVFMDAMPILDAYATDMITGSRARELLKLWVRGMERMALLVELEGTNTIKENTE